MRIGIDTGGTFTDFVIATGDRVTAWKEPSTPAQPEEAILAGLRHVATGAPLAGAEIIHGSTVATNALLEGRTERIGFVTNRGFEDLLEIGRQARPDLYDPMVTRPEPLAPRDLRFGIAGRIRADGSVSEPLDEPEIADLARRCAHLGLRSVAICLLHSYANPAHERRVADLLARAGLEVSVSSRLVPEHREYERASTTAVNAAVSPVVSRYLQRLSAGLEPLGVRGLRVMGSNGGALSARAAGEEAVRTVLSGPAAGVRAALHVGRAIGCPDLISFDMGGTSTDVCLIPGAARTTGEAMVAGRPVRIPTIDIHTVGAGGGSIAWRDPGGALRVGPASAGAEPGPACYGRGGPATVTDANLLLGRILPGRFLDGRMPLDAVAARQAIGTLGEQLALDPLATAEGIVAVAEATMARAIRVISLHRGFEPGDFALLAFGGAGGLHAASVAASLGIGRVVIPWSPGTFSAFGMTVADVLKDRSVTLLRREDRMSPAALEEAYRDLEAACRSDLAADGVAADRVSLERTLDVRYHGQSYELNVPHDPAWTEGFHREHERRFGYSRRGEPIELVTLRVRGIGRVEPIGGPVTGGPQAPTAPDDTAPARDLRWEGRHLAGRVHERATLAGGPPVTGPALVVESGATTFVPPGWSLRAEPAGHLAMWSAGAAP